MSNYNKMSKEQLINLLKKRDEQLNEIQSRLEVVERKLADSELSKRIINIERNGYRQEQYGRRECIEIVGLSERIRKNLGVTGKIYINESLYPEFRRLFGIANAFFKKKMLVSLYTLNGSIRIGVKGDNIQRTIEHISDLKAIFGNEAVENVISEHKSK